MPQEPLVWRVRLAEGQPAKLAAIILAAILAAVVGAVLFHGVVFALLGLLVILGSTTEFWLGARYKLDESGATARAGPSVSFIEWTNVKRLIVNDAGVTLSPLAADSRLTPFRGVFLRAGELGMDGLLNAIEKFGGENVRRLV